PRAENVEQLKGIGEFDVGSIGLGVGRVGGASAPAIVDHDETAAIGDERCERLKISRIPCQAKKTAERRAGAAVFAVARIEIKPVASRQADLTISARRQSHPVMSSP